MTDDGVKNRPAISSRLSASILYRWSGVRELALALFGSGKRLQRSSYNIAKPSLSPDSVLSRTSLQGDLGHRQTLRRAQDIRWDERILQIITF